MFLYCLREETCLTLCPGNEGLGEKCKTPIARLAHEALDVVAM